jgi:hypothetical protein
MADEIKLTQSEYLLAEAVMKLAAIERLLIKHEVINAEELFQEVKIVSDEVIAFVSKQSKEEQKPIDKDKN